MNPASPEESAKLEEYQQQPNKAAGEWLTYQSARWAARNPVDLEATDDSFRRRYGLTKTWAVRDALRGVPRDISCLEVGCSAGGFLAVLRAVGFEQLTGTDIGLEPLLSHPKPRAPLVHADAHHLPFRDGVFDLVATAGTLMHLGPQKRMAESIAGLARVTRRWLFVAELYAPGPEPMMVSFGELLPPVWLFAWDRAIPTVLGPQWVVRYHQVYELGKNNPGLSAPLCFTLLERA